MSAVSGVDDFHKHEAQKAVFYWGTKTTCSDAVVVYVHTVVACACLRGGGNPFICIGPWLLFSVAPLQAVFSIQWLCVPLQCFRVARGRESFSKHWALAVASHKGPTKSVFHTLLVCTLIVVMCAV